MLCEKCFIEHDGTYGSGRFCSQKCARSFSTYKDRTIINLKVSKSLTGRRVADGTLKPKSEDSIKKQSESLKLSLYNKTKDNPVRMHDGTYINITKEQLNFYRESHPVCEICGKQSSITYTGNTRRTTPNKLSIDHDHTTNKFRGLLCQNCNSRLGWYENHKDIIDDYLLRGQ